MIRQIWLMSRNIRLLCRCAWLLCGAIRFEIARKIEEQRRRVEPSVLWRYRCNLARGREAFWRL